MNGVDTNAFNRFPVNQANSANQANSVNLDEYEVVDFSNEEIDGGKSGPPGNFSGSDALKAGKVKGGIWSEPLSEHLSAVDVKGSKTMDSVRRAASERDGSAWSAVKTFFRNLMGVCNTIRSWFSSLPSADGVEGMTFNRAFVSPCKDEQVAPPDAVGCSNKSLGVAFGIGENVRLNPFSREECEQIKGGDFSLSDIKQDPALQDCWFLSSLGAVLASRGPKEISERITFPPPGTDDGFAYVKLGVPNQNEKTYKVPLGEIVGNDGTKSVSNSKPWVRLMETAMQMYMLDNWAQGNGNSIGGKLTMSNNYPSLALGALCGIDPNGDTMKSELYDKRDPSTFGRDALVRKAKLIQNSIRNNYPVTLGTPDILGKSLRTGISPKHAVTVLDVRVAKGADLTSGYLTVLDPYGKTKVISLDEVATCTVTVCEKK